MDIKFDDPSSESATLFYEKKTALTQKERLYQNHRRLLVNSMLEAGFTYHPEEWWHFNDGNRPWTDVIGVEPLFESAETEFQNMQKH